jgi:hypothetical protein
MPPVSSRAAEEPKFGVYPAGFRRSHVPVRHIPGILLVASALLCLAASRLQAQGGPPMITDDPGTPGNGHWEINTAWTDQRTPGSTLIGAPLLDANYGVGERLQLNFQASWNVLRDAESQESGMSESQVAAKWRFFDAGDTGLQLSTYPRITFLDPGSDAARRGVTDSPTSFLLPLEARRDFGPLSLNVDFGHTFCDERNLRGWMGGVCIGREVLKGWELDVETHADGSDRLQRSEGVINMGTRIDLSANATLLLAVGRDVHNSLGPTVSLLTYVGVQVRL